MVRASSSPLDIYTKYGHIPPVGVSSLMMRYDNEWVPVVPDPRSDCFCPIFNVLLDRYLQQASTTIVLLSFSTKAYFGALRMSFKTCSKTLTRRKEEGPSPSNKHVTKTATLEAVVTSDEIRPRGNLEMHDTFGFRWNSSMFCFY